MRTSLRSAFGATLTFGLALALAACPSDGKLPIGSACNSGDQCLSGLCAGDVCLDPEGDEDGDRLTNSLEHTLGSDPFNADTDGDGIPDGDELDGISNVDTDGDGLPDVIESATADLDGDCITDQYDAQNEVQNADLSPMRDVVCSALGICEGQDRALFGVLCPEGLAVCDYTNVVGYEAPEATCDGLDQDCDGAADEGFPDQDDDGVADCVDTDFDNDGVDDDSDNCPRVANGEQLDAQGDGIGDACATDFDLGFTLAPVLNVTAGAPFSVTVALQDADGAVATRFHGAVTLTLQTSDNGAAALTGTATVNAVDGVATFTGLVISPAGLGLALVASSGDLASGTSATFDAIGGDLAELRATGAPTARVAGDPLSVTLTAWDAFDNVLTGFAGTVAFSATDPLATLPPDYTYTASDAGAHAFDDLVLFTSGAQTVTVSDASNDAALATFEVTVVHAAAAGLVVPAAPAPFTAGTPFSVTVTVVDAFGNVVTDFTGAVALTSTDPLAFLPAAYTFTAADQGVHVFTEVTLVSSGDHTVTAGSSGGATVTGGVAVTVASGSDVALELTGIPSPATAGAPFDVTLTVKDSFGNVRTDYAGTVALLSSDGAAVLPAAVVMTAANAGVASFPGVVLRTTGVQSLTAADAEHGVSQSTSVTVTAGAPASLTLTALPASVAAGAAQALTATVRDAWGNVATGFTGTAAVVTSDPKISATSLDFLANHQGQRTLSVTFQTAGGRSVTVDAGGALSATRSTTVTPAPASTFQLSSLPSQLTAGSPQSLTVTLYDAYGNVATAGASGAFTITSTDSAAILVPSSLTIGAADGGTKSFTATLVTAGAQTVTAAHAQLGSVDRPTTVRAAAANRVIATDLPPTVTAGVATSIVVRVADAYGNTVTGYGGIVNVSSSDPVVTLSPGASLTFPAGQPASLTLTATFETAGSQHLDFLDTGLGAGGVDATSTTVSPAAARDLVATPATGGAVAGTPFTFTVAIRDAFGNLATGYTGTVSFTSTDPIATLPAATQYTAAFAGTHDFSATLFTAGARRITATGSGLSGATSDDVDRTVSPRPTLHHMGLAPSASTVTAGAPFSATITPYDAWNNVITGFSGTVTMTLGDPAGTVPSPVTLTGVTTVTPIVMYTAGATPRLVTATYNAISNSGSVTVSPGAADHLGFSTQPSAGFVASSLPTFRVAVYDAWDNVKTDLAATPITVSLGRNAGPGHLGGTAVVNTASGVATFSAAQLDRPGRGYDLRASGAGGGAVRSDRFDVSWRPATLVGTPSVTGSGGCRDVSYTLAQTDAHRSDVLVEYRIGAGAWRRATQAPGTSPGADGTRGVTTSAAGVAHTFRWDVFGDLGPTNSGAVTVRLTPVIDGVAGTAKTTSPFSASLGWSVGLDEHPITAGIKPGPVAVGDFDRNGLDDLLTMARDSGVVDVFFQVSPGTFSEHSQQLDLSALDLVALRPWQASPHHTLGFFALDRLGDQLVVFTRTVQGVGAVGWSFSQVSACPTPATNSPVAMAVADVVGDATRDVAVACSGNGGSQKPTISIISSGGQGWTRGLDVALLERPTAVEIADLGHDGRRDLLVGTASGLVTLIYTGEGFCSSAACGAQTIAMPTPSAMAVADFDNDGMLDVFVVHGDNTASVVHGAVVYGPQGNAIQYLAPEVSQLALDVAATSVVAGDVDEDGRLDLVVGSVGGDSVEILLGKELAPWGVIATGHAPGSGVNSLWVGDLNADGMTDIVAGRDDAEAASVVVLGGKAFQQCRPSFRTSGVTRYGVDSEQQATRDVDGDGRPDAVWRTSYDSVVTGLVIGYGDGAGGYRAGYASYGTGQPPTDMALGDLNGDGLMDAVLNDGYTDNVDVALQVAGQPGAFASGYTSVPFADALASSLVIADLDNDGREDLAYLSSGGVRQYYGAAGGGLVTGTAVPISGGSPRGLGVADVNKDGYQDLAFYQYVDDLDSVCVQLSTGARTWQPAAAVKCVDVDAGAGRVQLVDLDGDGVEEMVYANAYDYYEPTLIEVRRQLTPDSGDFGPPEEFPSCYGGADLHFSDVDGDGRQDILISCGADVGEAPYGVMTALQAADGSFGALSGGFGTYTYTAWGHGVGDLDGDLLDDLTRAGSATRHARSGSGFVTPAAFTAAVGGYANAMATADLDGDGLVDVVTAGSSRFHVILQGEPGKLLAPVSYTLAGVSSVYGLALGDVDGDGRPDVVVGVYTTTGARQLRIYRQTLTAPATFDVVSGFTTLSPTGNGYPYVIAIDDFTGASAASVLVSQATFSGQDEFDVFFQGAAGTFTKVPSDPYTSAFPSPVVVAGFGWFGDPVDREPWVAGRCGSIPCVTLATLGGCDIPGTFCYKARTTIDLAGGAAAPLYTNLTGAAVADLDRDGYDDVVANLTGANGGHVYAVIRQDPNKPGEFLAMQTFSGASTSSPGELRLADIDHDGRLDIVAQYDGGAMAGYEVLRGLGTGTTFGEAFAVATALSNEQGPFTLDDLDLDGWLDLLTLTPSTSELLLAPHR